MGSNKVQRFAVATQRDQPQVVWDVDASRTIPNTWNGCVPANCGDTLFIHQCSGRTNLHAGAAETAFRLFKSGTIKCSHPCPTLFPHCPQGVNTPYILANPYATQATDAKIIIPVEEWVILDYRAMSGEIFRGITGDADVTADFFQFAVTKESATTFFHRHIGRTFC